MNIGLYPNDSRDWGEDDWHQFLQELVNNNLVSYEQVTSLVLGHLNPSQVGTSIASKKTFQMHYPPRKCWAAVRSWHFEQSGRCIDCGTRLELQADHVLPRELQGDEADRLDNMALRCRRCNVIRRPSHRNGGIAHLTTESALMWLLFTHQPKNYQTYRDLCRAYGMTMANIRFEETWAMARWLEREGLYYIDETSIF